MKRILAALTLRMKPLLLKAAVTTGNVGAGNKPVVDEILVDTDNDSSDDDEDDVQINPFVDDEAMVQVGDGESGAE